LDESQLGFALSSTGSEVVQLTHADGVTGQDYFDYGLQSPDVSNGRYPDGASTWKFLASPSRAANNGCGLTELQFVTPDEFSWEPYPGASTYDLVRGSLDLLRANTGDFGTAITGCLEDNDDDTLGIDLQDPTSGAAFFYLVRVVDTPCGVGTFDSLHPAQVGLRDTGIDGVAAACP